MNDKKHEESVPEPTDNVPEAPEYVPDPEKEKQARAVHFAVSIIRLLGVAILMLGIAIALERFPPVPFFVGYVLILLGLAQMWIVPLWIVRQFVKARVAEAEMADVADKPGDA